MKKRMKTELDIWLDKWRDSKIRTPFNLSPEQHSKNLVPHQELLECPDTSWLWGTCWSRQAAILINPRWILASYHWRYGVGKKVFFVDPKTNELFSRKITHTVSIGNEGDDLTISKLDSDVTEVPIVNLPPVSRILKSGTRLLTTLDGPQIFPATSKGSYKTITFSKTGKLISINRQLRVSVSGNGIYPGDSNHPVFAPINNKMCAVCIYNIDLQNNDGAGTYLGRRDIQNNINEVIFNYHNS